MIANERIRIANVSVLSPVERVIPGAFPPGQMLSIRDSVFCDIELLFEHGTISDQRVPLFDTLDELAYDIGQLADGAEWDICIMTEAALFGKAEGGRIQAYRVRPGPLDKGRGIQNHLGWWDRDAVLAELDEKKEYYTALFGNVA